MIFAVMSCRTLTHITTTRNNGKNPQIMLTVTEVNASYALGACDLRYSFFGKISHVTGHYKNEGEKKISVSINGKIH